MLSDIYESLIVMFLRPEYKIVLNFTDACVSFLLHGFYKFLDVFGFTIFLGDTCFLMKFYLKSSSELSLVPIISTEMTVCS